jgi:hypothetical protein
MLSFLNKKAGVYPTDSKWMLYQGQNDGKPMFVRRNDSAKQLQEKFKFDFIVGVSIPFLNSNLEGFPQGEESELFGQIEDDLFDLFEKEQSAIVVLIITTGGMREFISYSQNPSVLEKCIDDLKQKYIRYNFQVYIEEDKKWSLYSRFV